MVSQAQRRGPSVAQQQYNYKQWGLGSSLVAGLGGGCSHTSCCFGPTARRSPQGLLAVGVLGHSQGHRTLPSFPGIPVETQVSKGDTGLGPKDPKGRKAVPLQGVSPLVDSRCPGWHQEAVIRGQAQVLSPHRHRGGPLLGERNRRNEWRLLVLNTCWGILSVPGQGGPRSWSGLQECKAQEEPGPLG